MAETPVIIRRVIQEDDHGHHGGAWKIAFADFMTAMMAFFLLMWLVGASDEEQRKGIADYFTPSLSEAGGRGQGVLAGEVPAEDGMLAGGTAADEAPEAPTFGQGDPIPFLVAGAPAAEAAEAAEAETPDAEAPDSEAAAEAAEALRAAIEAAVAAAPELAGLQRHLRFEALPEGLYVQIVDDAERSMFERGSAELRGGPLALVRTVGRAVAGADHPVVITGHTDALPFRAGAGYTNWELSTDRAHATRRELEAFGVDSGRVLRISGRADTEPLDPVRPLAPQNRRIGILIRTADAPGPSSEETLAHLTLH